MIDEVLNEIREAEAEAEQMQNDAYQQAKDIILQAEMQADLQKKKTVRGCKANQREAIALAESRANERRAFILSKGTKLANELLETHQSSLDTVADKLVATLIERY